MTSTFVTTYTQDQEECGIEITLHILLSRNEECLCQTVYKQRKKQSQVVFAYLHTYRQTLRFVWCFAVIQIALPYHCDDQLNMYICDSLKFLMPEFSFVYKWKVLAMLIWVGSVYVSLSLFSAFFFIANKCTQTSVLLYIRPPCIYCRKPKKMDVFFCICAIEIYLYLLLLCIQYFWLVFVLFNNFQLTKSKASKRT